MRVLLRRTTAFGRKFSVGDEWWWFVCKLEFCFKGLEGVGLDIGRLMDSSWVRI